MESTVSFSRDAAPPLRPLIAATLFAVLVCLITGPFDTLRLPASSRLVFWLVLIGWNSAKWWLWYSWIGPRVTNRRMAALAALLGALLLNATMPLEIDLMFRAIGRPVALPWFGLYVTAVIVGGSISVLTAVLRSPRGAAPPAKATAEPLVAVPAATPLLAQRAGLPDLADVLMVTAEDHYLRLVLTGGPKDYLRPLVLFRFGDALPELAELAGAQVHRSAWVARRHVAGVRRDGRRWLLVLADGSQQAISETYLPALRAAGWLQTKL